jgi:hypothetical protein
MHRRSRRRSGRVDLSRIVIIACVVMYVVSLAIQPGCHVERAAG